MTVTYFPEININIDKLETCNIQAAWRTKNTKLIKEIAEDIVKNGLNNIPIVFQLGDRFVIGAGHRRIAAQKLNGVNNIKVQLRQAKSLSEIEQFFANEDRVVLKQQGRDKLYGWSKCTDKESYLRSSSKDTAKSIVEFVKIFGEARSNELALQGKSPGSWKAIRRFENYLKAFEFSDIPPIKDIGEWILKYSATNIVNTFVTMGYAGPSKIPGRKILEAIKQDRAIGMGDMGLRSS